MLGRSTGRGREPPGRAEAVGTAPAGRGGLNDDQKKAMDEAIAVLKQQGAIIIDPADIPSVTDKDPKNNFMLWNQCSGVNEGRGKDEHCSIDFKYGMKRDFNTWLASLGPAAPVKTLKELIAWNTAHQKAGAIKYGQSNLDISDEMDLDKDRARYEADRAKDIRLGGTHGIDEVMKAERLDAILFPARKRRRHRREAGLPDRHRAVRVRAECADAGISGRLQRQADAVRRQLHRHGLQRAEADRAGVCVRAGDEETRAAAAVPVSDSGG